MKIVVFNSSPKGPKSNTQVIVDAFLAGAAEAGAGTESVFLVSKKIRPCTACTTCWVKTPGRCSINDDMHALREQYLSADVAVFATPLYVDNVSGIMKNFMDRLLPLVDPHFEMKPDGETGHRAVSEHRPGLGVISNCGYPEQSQFQVLSLLIRRMTRNMNVNLAFEIYRGGGGILTISNPMLDPIIDGYKKLVAQAGREFAQTGQISEDTQRKLDQPLAPPQIYIDNVNRMWDKQRAKHATAGTD